MVSEVAGGEVRKVAYSSRLLPTARPWKLSCQITSSTWYSNWSPTPPPTPIRESALLRMLPMPLRNVLESKSLPPTAACRMSNSGLRVCWRLVQNVFRALSDCKTEEYSCMAMSCSPASLLCASVATYVKSCSTASSMAELCFGVSIMACERRLDKTDEVSSGIGSACLRSGRKLANGSGCFSSVLTKTGISVWHQYCSTVQLFLQAWFYARTDRLSSRRSRPICTARYLSSWQRPAVC